MNLAADDGRLDLTDLGFKKLFTTFCLTLGTEGAILTVFFGFSLSTLLFLISLLLIEVAANLEVLFAFELDWFRNPNRLRRVVLNSFFGAASRGVDLPDGCSSVVSKASKGSSLPLLSMM